VMVWHSGTDLVEHCSSGTFLTVVAQSGTERVWHFCSDLVLNYKYIIKLAMVLNIIIWCYEQLLYLHIVSGGLSVAHSLIRGGTDLFSNDIVSGVTLGRGITV